MSGTPRHGSDRANNVTDSFTSNTPMSSKLADMLLQLKATEGQINLASPFLTSDNSNKNNNSDNEVTLLKNIN